MNASEVADLVANELAGRVATERGWNFKRCLVQPPERGIFGGGNGHPWALWIVLREASGCGYMIGYDEEDLAFVLVTTEGVPISQYRTLMAAIDGMWMADQL